MSLKNKSLSENSKQKKAVVLLSGGMDSAFCLMEAINQGYQPAALHLNYCQKTEDRELKAFNDLCDHYGIDEKLIVNIEYLAQIGGSSLTDDSIHLTDSDLDSNEIPSSYVPFRNGNILSIAVSWAEVISAESIFIGAMQQDSSGYPDCRDDFFSAFEKAINIGTKPNTKIKLISPIIDFSKEDIVRKGMKLGLPFELTWSCYQNSEKACGLCDSCALRLRGFAKSGFKDPLDYQTRPKY